MTDAPPHCSPASSLVNFVLALALAALVAASAGCRRGEPSAQDSVALLEKAFPKGGNNEAIQVAIAAAKSDDHAVGVIALQTAKRAPGLTAEQLMSVEQASQALTADLTRRADAGDAKAKASLDLIARTRSQ